MGEFSEPSSDGDALPFIYLDNAATSWPKPAVVLEGINRFYSDYGVAASRGRSPRADFVDRTIQKCRLRLKQLLNAAPNDQVVFGFNGTDVLNTAIQGVIRDGDQVVATVSEHNSVLRPLDQIQRTRNVDVQLARCNNEGVIDVQHLDSLLSSSTRLVCVSHVSNVTGVIQPINEISRICKKRGAFLLVDAGQSVGHIPIDVQGIGCDLLAAAGHKGLMGPLGTAFLYLSENVSDHVAATRPGGTGTQSELAVQPVHLPERLESGNLNGGGIFGLLAGIEFVLGKGIERIHSHECELHNAMVDALSNHKQISIYGCSEQKTGILSLNIRDLDCRTVASMLDASFGIHVRAGLHCAPKMHESFGTFDMGGTIRISPGIFSTESDTQILIHAIDEIVSSMA